MSTAVDRNLTRTLTRSRLSVPCQLVVDGGEIVDKLCLGSKQSLTPVGGKAVLVTTTTISVAVADLAERPKAGHTIAAGRKRSSRLGSCRQWRRYVNLRRSYLRRSGYGLRSSIVACSSISDVA